MEVDPYVNYLFCIKLEARTVYLIANFEIFPYKEVGLNPNVIMNHNKLHIRNECKIGIITSPWAPIVGPITSSEGMRTLKELLAPKACEYRMKYKLQIQKNRGASPLCEHK